MKEIALGTPVKDSISGFEGVSIARIVYLNGCIQHEVQALADDGNKMQVNQWIDENQLVDMTPTIGDSRRVYVRTGGGGERNHPPKD